MTTIQKLSAINNSLVPGPSKDVNRADIKTVLVSNGAYAAMKAYVANPGGANQQALIACNYLLAIVDYEPAPSARCWRHPTRPILRPSMRCCRA
jgi:hypothetical protein